MDRTRARYRTEVEQVIGQEKNRLLNRKSTGYWRGGGQVIGQEESTLLDRRSAGYWTVGEQFCEHQESR